MKTQNFKSAILVSSTMLTLIGCALGPKVGTEPAAVPPKIVLDQTDKKDRIWDNPSAFGPVPVSEKARGDKVCSSMDKDNVKYKPLGFHPKAQDLDGKTFDGGGFLCVSN
ncbi:MAG: hypothetical protein ACOYBR_04385 [Fluviibacter sp.]